MPRHHIEVRDARSPIDFDALRAEVEVPTTFPAEVLQAAEAAARAPRLPERDATDLPLVTVDPPGARDLDQAVGIETRPGGWRVHYAIADVGAWVAPGEPVDAEARRRTQTFYAPDRNVPLHPPVLGEQAASLLPDGARPAVLWRIDVDDDGSPGQVVVDRALVRSRAQLTYQDLQEAIDAGDAPAGLGALPGLGAALLADARRRDAIDLHLPDQEVVPDGRGHWTIRLRDDLAVEEWNAQISLLTGRSAARLMLEAEVGILRTLPAADVERFPHLREVAGRLGIEWRDGDHPGDVLARLDANRPRHAAFADLAAELLRGAGYTHLDGSIPDDPGHGGVGAPYTHVTAPLRRLVDRFATETCLCIVGDRPLPGWLDEALATAPSLMADGDRRAKTLDRMVVDATEAFVLHGRVGEHFSAAVIETGPDVGTVVLDEPAAIRGPCDAPDLPLGAEITVRCTEADVERRTVRFERVETSVTS